jgi:ABC-2 type transport system ATP-binding protein
MIEVRSLKKRYGSLVAVDGLDLAVGKGDLCGFIGPNGAGKTTTLKILSTLLRADAGTVRIAGLSVDDDAALVRRKIGYMPDSFGVYEDMTVREYLEFFAALYGLDAAAGRKVIGDVLVLVDLAGKEDAGIDTLSRGVQQRLGLARVLVHDPEVLFLDEPASGLDPRARIEIRALLRELRNMGKTILVSSHILSDLAEICNRVAIVEKGRLLYQGDVRSLIERGRRAGRVHVRVAGRADEALSALRGDARVASADPETGPGNGAPGTAIEIALAPSCEGHAFVADVVLRAGSSILELHADEPDLEDAFMRLTKGEIG